MIASVPVQVAVLVALVICSAFCSGSETAFFSLSPLRIRRIGLARPALARRLQELMRRPTRLLSAILIVNTLANIALSALGYTLAGRFFPGRAEQIAIPAMTAILLVFGEVGPKRAGLLYPDVVVRVMSPVMSRLIAWTAPLRFALESVTRALQRHFPRRAPLSDDEFESVVDFSRKEGVINAEELAMVKAINDLEETRASDVMTPRVDLKGIDRNDPPADLPAHVRAARMHYLLLYRDQLDNVEGFLDARRLLLDPEHRLEAATLPPFYVPESIPLDELLSQFQKTRRRAAVVVDEYGGTAGIVTRGDILEEISGDIYQELSKPRPVFQQAGPRRWLVDANISLDELNRKLGLDLEAEDADRLSGWLAAQLEHIPEPNETVEAQGCRATVLQTNRRRVTLAMIEIGSAP